VIAQKPADPRRPNDADAPQPAIQRPAVLLAQVADDEDRAARLRGQADERHQRPPHRLVAGRRRIRPQERRQRVDNQQPGPVLANGFPKAVDVLRQRERVVELPQHDAIEVGPGPAEPGADGVLGRVLAVDEDRRHRPPGQFAAR
jgi:hypothetical protein